MLNVLLGTNTCTGNIYATQLAASLVTLCSKPRARQPRPTHVSVNQRRELSSVRAAAAFLPKLCRQSGSDLDCLEP